MIETLQVVYDDGGRSAAGFFGEAGDCVVRAISIATQQNYRVVYDAINTISRQERHVKMGKRSNSRNGVYRCTYNNYLCCLGAIWTPTMGIGTGCKVHLRQGEIPSSGRLVVVLSKHLIAVLDGVIHDKSDPSRNGWRCVYGYYTLPNVIGGRDGATKDMHGGDQVSR